MLNPSGFTGARVFSNEQGRLEFLVQRDGAAATVEWARRTMGIYRRAVLDKRHFASTSGYRQPFIESYCEFKRWLTAIHASQDRDGTS
jgi:hypothetical protein